MNRPWRIAHSEFSLGWGGQEHRVLAELEGFRRRGHEVFLVAPRVSKIWERAVAAGISTVELPTSKPRLIASVLRLGHWLGQNRVDVLNTHSSRDGWFVALAGRFAGVPLIIRTRHVEVDYRQPWISRHAFTTLADHVLTTSDRIREGLCRRLRLHPTNVTTLPTGIDPERFTPVGQGSPEMLELRKAGRRLIGMVCVLRSWKGHNIFIEAARRLHQQGLKADFVIVGAGPMEEKIRQWIAEAGMKESFHLLGHVEDVPGVLRSLDALAIPSYGHEGVPQIGLQALACETPVVGSDVGGIPEIIRPGETGRIFPSKDSAALATGLTAALKQKRETERMTRQGRESVENNHSIDHMLDQLEDMYERLAPSEA
ncbi:MAG: glycosyltransferase family 4 protein [Limisphaerales bacterium]